ncbi:glycerophosphodiester phosphodiesterase [Brachybacterium sp. AOP43-C2-M15]|uniref:glycerophosphodiester phosphodiesterase n=1 Tax=Brachybacterium sp. AOP43-C2-M15 TaxID=3457661 RepID=UPI0040336ED8
MTAQHPAIVGHRGAAALEPENTLLSFRRGAAEGSQWLECDVHLSSDGRDVIIHDATLDRTAQEDSPLRTGRVGDLTRAELDQVLVGEGEHLPTLAEVLDTAVREDGDRIPLLVEIKDPAAADLVVGILRDYFGELSWQEPTDAPAWVISFHEEPLRRTAQLAPGIPLMRTTKATSPEWWLSCRELGVSQVGVRIVDAVPADVEQAAEIGAQLNLWTARTEEQLARALELGCDTLTVDDPAWALDQLASRSAG